jgi:hypothetical protein
MINILRYLYCFKNFSYEKKSYEKIKIERMRKLPLYNRYSKIYML